MKRILIVLGLVFIAGNVFALSFISSSESTSEQTLVSAACYIHRVTISNSGANPCTVAFADSGTAKGYVCIPAKDTKKFDLQARCAGQFRITQSNSECIVMVEYTSGTAYGRYWYAVSNSTTQDTVYNYPANILAVIVSNTNTDTGYISVISDSYTDKVFITCPASDSVMFDFEKIWISGKIQVKNLTNSMSCIVFRKE